MRSATSLRAASVATALLFVGHSAGGLGSWSPLGRTAIFESMRSFRFPVNGFDRSYWHFYIGFGWTISVYLLAQAVLLWQLGGLAAREPLATRRMVAVFFAVTIACVLLDLAFFFVAPLVLSVAIAAFLGLALIAREA